MQIDRGVFQVRMAEKQLNGSQIGAGFQVVRSKTVTQRIVVLLMICTRRRFAIVITLSLA